MGTATTNGDRTPLTVHDWMGYATPPKPVMDATDDLVTAEFQFRDGVIEIEELNEVRREWRGINVENNDAYRELAAIADQATVLARRTDERLGDVDAVLCVLMTTLDGMADRVAAKVTNTEQSDLVRGMLAGFFAGCEQQLPKCRSAINVLRTSTKELSDRAHASIGGGS